MQQESKKFSNSALSAASPWRSKPASIQPVSDHEKCQILAKKGFLVGRDISSGLVLLVYSGEFQLGVLVHLPVPSNSPSPDIDTQGQAFARSAIAMILSEFESLGVYRDNLVTYVVGGSATDTQSEVSKVTAQRALWSYGLSLSACDLGGNLLRSIWMDVETGRIIVRSESLTKDSLAAELPLKAVS